MLGETPPRVILAHRCGARPAVESIRPPRCRYARPVVDTPALLSICPPRVNTPAPLLIHLACARYTRLAVHGRDVAGLRAPTGLVTWRRRGRSTRVVVDAGVDGAGVVDVGVVDLDARWLGTAGEGG